MAAMAGRYAMAAPLPADPAPFLPTVLPDGPYDLPTCTARQAFDLLIAVRAPGAGPELAITAVELDTVTFASDRGPLPLPVWLFTAPGVQGHIAVPAIADPAFWSRGPHALVMAGDARLGADGRTLTVTMPLPDEALPGWPRFRCEPALLESASAVVIGLRGVPDGTEPGVPGTPRRLSGGRVADLTVTLAAPLGGRVLVAPVAPAYVEVFAVEPELGA